MTTKRFDVRGTFKFMSELPTAQTKKVAQKRLDTLATLINANLPPTDVLGLTVEKVGKLAF